MGYQVNFFAKFHNPADEFIILTTDSFSLWKSTNYEEIINQRDRLFEEKYKVKIIRNKARLDRNGKNNLWITELIPTINKINPDVIFTHGIETFTTFRILFRHRLFKKYLLTTDTHTLLNQFNKSFKLKLFNSFIRYFIAPKINRYKLPVFYTTPENELILRKIYAVSSENIFPCLIGTDFNDYYRNEEAGKKTRYNYQIAEDETVILYVGKLNQLKQPHLLLESIKSIEGQIGCKTKIMFVGSPDKSYTDKYFNIEFNNPLISTLIVPAVISSELYKFYSAADFAVFPKENTLSALDAQACKLPVIMEDDETNRERLKMGGLIYEKGNPDSLAEKILLLMNDHDLKKRLSEEGFEYIRQNFNYSFIVREMENRIESSFRKR